MTTLIQHRPKWGFLLLLVIALFAVTFFNQPVTGNSNPAIQVIIEISGDDPSVLNFEDPQTPFNSILNAYGVPTVTRVFPNAKSADESLILTQYNVMQPYAIRQRAFREGFRSFLRTPPLHRYFLLTFNEPAQIQQLKIDLEQNEAVSAVFDNFLADLPHKQSVLNELIAQWGYSKHIEVVPQDLRGVLMEWALAQLTKETIDFPDYTTYDHSHKEAGYIYFKGAEPLPLNFCEMGQEALVPYECNPARFSVIANRDLGYTQAEKYLMAWASQHGLEVVHKIPLIHAFVFQKKESETSSITYIQELEGDPNVFAAWPSTTGIEIFSTASYDPLYGSSSTWYYDNNSDQYDMDYEAAVRNYSAQFAEDILVGVIDTGLNIFHADFHSMGTATYPDLTTMIPSVPQAFDDKANGIHTNNIYVNPVEHFGTYGVDDDGNGFVDDTFGFNFFEYNQDGYVYEPDEDIIDSHGHGTTVSGIIGAELNGVGTVGMLWATNLISAKIGHCLDGACESTDMLKFAPTENVALAITYLGLKGVSVVNMSFGFSSPDVTVLNAMESFKNVAFAACAGQKKTAVNGVDLDSSRNQLFPAEYNLKNSITVTSYNKNNQLVTNANYGKKKVHIAAPGDAIVAPDTGFDGFVPNNNGYTSSAKGTSFATAFITGAIAAQMSTLPYSPDPYTDEENREVGRRSAEYAISCIKQTVVTQPDMAGKTHTEGRLQYIGAANCNSTTDKSVCSLNPGRKLNSPIFWIWILGLPFILATFRYSKRFV